MRKAIFGALVAFLVLGSAHVLRADEAITRDEIRAEAEAELDAAVQNGDVPEGTQIQIETNVRFCKTSGMGCFSGSECCNRRCNAGRCAFGSDPFCRMKGATCFSSIDCCSRYCSLGRCR